MVITVACGLERSIKVKKVSHLHVYRVVVI